MKQVVKVADNETRTPPDGWIISKLKDHVDSTRGICYGIVQPGRDKKSGIPIVRVNNIRNNRVIADGVMHVDEDIEAKYKRSRLRGGEVLMTLVGSIGETAIVPTSLQGWNVARAVGVIPVNSTIEAEWIEYSLQSQVSKQHFATRANTTVQPTLNLSDLSKAEILVPPVHERKVIISILKNIDHKIILNADMNATLEAIGQALFKRWFVDFEFPGSNGKPYKNSGGKMMESELGPIPEGWTVTQLHKVIRFEKGKKPFDVYENSFDNALPLILIDNMNGGKYVYARREKMTIVIDTDVIMVMDGASSGRVERSHAGILGSTLAKIACSSADTSSFIYHLLKEHQKEIRENTTGTSIPHADKKKIESMTVALPYNELLMSFSHISEALLRKAIDAKEHTKQLTELRNILLPRLMSGKLRVSA